MPLSESQISREPKLKKSATVALGRSPANKARVSRSQADVDSSLAMRFFIFNMGLHGDGDLPLEQIRWPDGKLFMDP